MYSSFWVDLRRLLFGGLEEIIQRADLENPTRILAELTTAIDLLAIAEPINPPVVRQ